MGIRKSKPSAINSILWTILFLSLGILAFFFAEPVWSIQFLFIVISNIMFIFQKEEKKTSSDPPPIDRERDGIMLDEISALDFSPPLVNTFGTFLINGNDCYGKFFKFSERYIFVGINGGESDKMAHKAISKLLDSAEKLESEFLRFVHSEEIFKEHPAANFRISRIEIDSEAPFDEFYIDIVSDNPDYVYECILKEFKFYDVSEIRN